jgi:hypothetical protein
MKATAATTCEEYRPSRCHGPSGNEGKKQDGQDKGKETLQQRRHVAIAAVIGRFTLLAFAKALSGHEFVRAAAIAHILATVATDHVITAGGFL